MQSSNGVYVGTKRIPGNSSHDVKSFDTIGIGWTFGINTEEGKLKDDQKFVFKLSKEDITSSVIDRVQFQSENELDEIEEKIAALDTGKSLQQKQLSPIITEKLSLKRKSEQIKCEEIKKEIKEEKRCRIITMDDDVICLSDSDHEAEAKNINSLIEKVKFELENEENHKDPPKVQIKCENEYLEYEAFNVKQEYMGYDDEPILIDSDSDSDSGLWLQRLSQNSPGKPFSKMVKAKADEQVDDSSYSQMDDDFVMDQNYTDNENEEEFADDIIKILPSPEKSPDPEIQNKQDQQQIQISLDEQVSEINEIIPLQSTVHIKSPEQKTHPSGKDEIDGFKALNQIAISAESTKTVTTNEIKKAQMIEPLVHSQKRKTRYTISESKCFFLFFLTYAIPLKLFILILFVYV